MLNINHKTLINGKTVTFDIQNQTKNGKNNQITLKKCTYFLALQNVSKATKGKPVNWINNESYTKRKQMSILQYNQIEIKRLNANIDRI